MHSSAQQPLLLPQYRPVPRDPHCLVGQVPRSLNRILSDRGDLSVNYLCFECFDFVV